MNCSEILSKLKSMRNEENIAGMKRFAIPADYGVSAPQLRAIAKEVGKNHELALELWMSGKHEARMLCALIDDPKLVTSTQMDSWASDFDSWDLTDNTCMHLFWKTPFAYNKIYEWSKSKHEFIKRAAFTLIACLVVHDKKAPDSVFIDLLKIIKREASDERNLVRKAVNWALRGIGKRNLALNKKAVLLSRELVKSENKTARWIGSDALRELTGDKIRSRL